MILNDKNKNEGMGPREVNLFILTKKIMIKQWCVSKHD